MCWCEVGVVLCWLCCTCFQLESHRSLARSQHFCKPLLRQEKPADSREPIGRAPLSEAEMVPKRCLTTQQACSRTSRERIFKMDVVASAATAAMAAARRATMRVQQAPEESLAEDVLPVVSKLRRPCQLWRNVTS